jgi:hypothetical protein
MANFAFTVGELTNQIKKEGKMNIAHLGTDTDQSTYIMYYLTMAMWKYVDIVFLKKTSDALVVTANGYVTFQKDGVDIEDFYAPIRIYVGSIEGKSLIKRTSFEGDTGWFKETAQEQFHIKGAGTYVLQYRAYPAKATVSTQLLEWPSSSFDLLMFETIGKIKESLNDLEGAGAAYAIADKLIPVLIQANMSNSASNTGGVVPSQAMAANYRR